MNAEDFEKRLQSQPMRRVPPEWREQILSAALQASAVKHAPRNAHQADGIPSLLSTIHSQLSTLLWPHPAAWAGLAAVWLVILGLNLTTRDTALRIARRAPSPAPQVFVAFQEQQRLLAELIGPREPPAAEPPKPTPPRPRSERQRDNLMA